MITLRSMRRALLPSKTLTVYVIKMYIGRFLGILIGLCTVLQMLDLLAQADDIMAAEGADFSSIVSYLMMRYPQLMTQFIPFVGLLATLLTLATLNQNSEIIVMKATGLSSHKILLPLGVASGIIALAHFAFHDTIVTKANADLEYWKENDFAINLPPAPDVRGAVWLTEGTTLVRVNKVTKAGSRVILDNVSLIERDDLGRMTRMQQADFAHHQDGKWTLFGLRNFNINTHETTEVEQQNWTIPTPPERFLALTVRPKHVPYRQLSNSIDQLEREGLPTDTLKASLMQKIAAPAAILLMPLLGALAAFGVHRSGNLFMRLFSGMAMGFSFFVADNFMLSMGEFGVVPPFIAAWSPFILYLLIGYAVLFNTEEGSSPRVRPAKSQPV
ncbi:LPS export ABC transporter permease LptG [Temperatibacter marinus]|uniref:LPS export ABC transporter permease LptG n=1 Tax=Temperatibacter marinus TaxID=1456591 RepID=A0AA52EDY2_9PROT|nr:LPS export ABC transporter permease LptG [Temperatibacter marinus]WND01903.1 LPS export ABC transporter permease LptG [Temperatibacter marinus]